MPGQSTGEGTALEVEQAREIAELRSKLAAVEVERDRFFRQYMQESHNKEQLREMFVDLLSRLCQRD